MLNLNFIESLTHSINQVYFKSGVGKLSCTFIFNQQTIYFRNTRIKCLLCLNIITKVGLTFISNGKQKCSVLYFKLKQKASCELRNAKYFLED